jgi:heme-degrading monooxygenase HmoA
MIARIWHGWTVPANADAYESLLRTTIFPWIAGKSIAGFRRIELLRRPLESEVEFITIMWFDSLEAIKAFAGPQWDEAVVRPEARALLARFDPRSAHYEVTAEHGA